MWIRATVAAFLWVVNSVASAAGSAARPHFEETACNLAVHPGIAGRLRCGHVSVPRLHGDPSAGTYRLRVIVLTAARQPAPSDSILLLPGGPGISIARAFVAAPPSPIGDARDTVIIDPRSAGGSEPQVCQVLMARMGSGEVAADLTSEALIRRSRERVRTCLEEARAAGHLPEAFGSHVDADDIELVRRALGIAQWDVHAISYGAVTAMTLAARHPASIRSLLLDSPALAALQPLGMREAWEASFSRLVADCEADTQCRANYPDLRGELEQALSGLERDPLRIAGRDGSVVLNRGDFEFLLFNSSYHPVPAANIPAMIRAVAKRSPAAFLQEIAGRASAYAPDVSLSGLGATFCRDHPPGSKHRGGRPAGPAWATELVLPSEACDGWVDPEVAPRVPVARPPTLVMSGAIDPVTPPAVGREAARLMGEGTHHLEFPATGHGVVSQSPCAAAIFMAFLDDPSAPPDRSCLAQVPPLKFAPPAR
jgi:pimeloyl-ACP methyl ester carboxylesterase